MMIAARCSAASAVTQRGADQFAHLAPVGGEHHQRHDRERQCRPSITWLRIRSFAVPASPYQMVTIAAGTMAIARVISRRAQAGRRMSRKPSITI